MIACIVLCCVVLLSSRHAQHFDRNAWPSRRLIQYILGPKHTDVDKEDLRHGRVAMPSNSLHADTGTNSFYTFGHAVRNINISRGSKEGNNAFTKDDHGANRRDDRFHAEYIMEEGAPSGMSVCLSVCVSCMYVWMYVCMYRRYVCV